MPQVARAGTGTGKHTASQQLGELYVTHSDASLAARLLGKTDESPENVMVPCSWEAFACVTRYMAGLSEPILPTPKKLPSYGQSVWRANN